MNIPLLAITPTTAKMIANYHGKTDEGSRVRWLRIALVLHTAQDYNDGRLCETSMHARFDLALNGAAADVIQAERLLP